MTRYKPVTQTLPEYDFLVYKDGDYYKIQDGNSLSKVYKDKDPSVAVQKAIDLAPTGGRIFIKNGEYPLSTEISINKSLSLVCQGNAKFTNPNNLQRMIHVTADNVVIDGLVADGNKAIDTYEGIIRADMVKNLIVKNCILTNPFHGSCVRLQHCERSRIINNYFHYSFHGCVYLYSAFRCIVANNNAENDGTNGALVTAYASGEGHIIEGNVCRGGEFGVYLEYGLRSCVVSNNSFLSLHDMGAYPYYAQAIKIEGDGKNTIIGNTIRDVYGDGLVCRSPLNIFAHNTLELVKRRAIDVGSHYQIIESNTIKDCGYEANNTYPAIILSSWEEVYTKYCKIRNNIIMSEQSNLPSYGIQEESGCDYNEICYNRIENVVNKGVIWSGSNTKVAFNIGFVTENSGEVTIPAGSSYVDVTHGLDITPDINKIRITPKDNLNGRDYWISDVNSSTFRINISSSDSVDHTFGWSYYN